MLWVCCCCYSSLQTVCIKFGDSVAVQSTSAIISPVWQHCSEQVRHIPVRRVFLFHEHALMSTIFQLASQKPEWSLPGLFLPTDIQDILWGLPWVKDCSVPALQPQASLALRQFQGLLNLELLTVPQRHRLYVKLYYMDECDQTLSTYMRYLNETLSMREIVTCRQQLKSQLKL